MIKWNIFLKEREREVQRREEDVWWEDGVCAHSVKIQIEMCIEAKKDSKGTTMIGESE